MKYIKFVYKLGAAIDLYFVFALVFPSIWAFTFRMDHYNPDISERLAIMTGASLMLGWTCLLLWADKEPVKRKFILILTFCPVVSGFLLLLGYDLLYGQAELKNVVLILVKLLVLSTLLITAYMAAIQLEKEN